MSEHIIITYSAEKAGEGHVDPNFTQLVYGDRGNCFHVFLCVFNCKVAISLIDSYINNNM
ncbi:hypothetical protein CT694_31355 (plasmid) [Bacillus wiedmannii bv. thuringiensis]|nr:hypothetical protein CT694_31355 [Bacillus wiedmannii bv. thuringiensis]